MDSKPVRRYSGWEHGGQRLVYAAKELLMLPFIGLVGAGYGLSILGFFVSAIGVLGGVRMFLLGEFYRAGVLLTASSLGLLISWCVHKASKAVAQHIQELIPPPPEENPVLPDEQLLVRASAPNSETQRAELLRASTDTIDTPPEQLLRATNGTGE